MTDDNNAQSTDRQLKGHKRDLNTKLMDLSQFIQIPYSRHSSYTELCNLVRLFIPIDVYPCVVRDYFYEESLTIEKLFGEFCAQNIFHYFDSRDLPKLTEIYNERIRSSNLTLDLESVKNATIPSREQVLCLGTHVRGSIITSDTFQKAVEKKRRYSALLKQSDKIVVIKSENENHVKRENRRVSDAPCRLLNESQPASKVSSHSSIQNCS